MEQQLAKLTQQTATLLATFQDVHNTQTNQGTQLAVVQQTA